MKKPILQFKPGDKIIRKGIKYLNSQILIIDYIDYTRNVYIFVDPWINSLSKFKSLNFDKTETIFKLAE